ncbi:MAG: tetratricopeptide repeat protein [Candidatus Natronoplasma sp.]
MSKKDEVLDTVQKLDRDDFERLCLKVLEGIGFEISNIKSVSGDILAEGTIQRENETKNFIIKFTRSCEDISSEVKSLKGLISPSTEGLLFTTEKFEGGFDIDEKIEVVGGIKLYQLLEKFNLLSDLDRYKEKKNRIESQRAIEDGKNKALDFLKKGEALLEEGKNEKAVELLEKSLEINPKDVKCWILLGDSYDAVDRKKEAVEAYNKAIDIGGDNLEVLKKKGRILYEMKRYDEAILCFEDILELDPDSKEVWNNKALSHMRNGEYEESLESITNALSIDPRFEEALLNKALIFENMGKIERALEISNELIESSPDRSEYHYVKGAYLKALERYGEALDQMNRALELDSNNEKARSLKSEIEKKIEK